MPRRARTQVGRAGIYKDASGKPVPVSQAEHYAHRGATLASFSLYEWLVGFQVWRPWPLRPAALPLRSYRHTSYSRVAPLAGVRV